MAHEIARGQRLHPVGRQARSRHGAGPREPGSNITTLESLPSFFVRSEIVVEFEECLPVDKPTRCAFSSTHIVWIRVVGVLRIVEEKGEDRGSASGPEVQTIARTNL